MVTEARIEGVFYAKSDVPVFLYIFAAIIKNSNDDGNSKFDKKITPFASIKKSGD
jgi:hypothetical protein